MPGACTSSRLATSRSTLLARSDVLSASLHLHRVSDCIEGENCDIWQTTGSPQVLTLKGSSFSFSASHLAARYTSLVPGGHAAGWQSISEAMPYYKIVRHDQAQEAYAGFMLRTQLSRMLSVETSLGVLFMSDFLCRILQAGLK